MPTLPTQSKFSRRIFGILILVIGSLLITTILSVRSWYKPSVKLNEVSPITIVLDKDYQVFDQVATNLAKEKARLSAIKYVGNKEILEEDYNASHENLENLKFLVRIVRDEISYRKAHPEPLNSKICLETQDYLMELPDQKYGQVLLSTDYANLIRDDMKVEELGKLSAVEKKYLFDNLTQIREYKKRASEEKQALGGFFFDSMRRVNYEDIFVEAFRVQKKLLDLGIVRGTSRNKIHANIKILYPSMPYSDRLLIEKLIDRSTSPNLEINLEKLRALEKEAMDSVQPVITPLKKGARLATKGQMLTEQNYYYLKELNMLHAKPDFKEIKINFLWVLVAVFLVAIYMLISKYKKYTLRQLSLVFLVASGISSIAALLGFWGLNKVALLPFAAISILLTIFYLPTLAAITITLLSIFMIKMMDLNFWQVLPLSAGAFYGIFLVKKANQREDLANAGFQIAIAQVLSFLVTLVLAVEEFKVSSVLIVAFLYIASGISSGFIAIAALPYLESAFKLLNQFKLAELSNPNQVLLKRLREEAPGTYEHSLSVSRLSEEAASFVSGVNTELIRVGLLYHDIGKLHAPEYFIENTLGKPNPHTTLDDPKKSAEIILAHVPEGVKLAKKHNLPQAIIDFIPMHQGTTVTNYFHYKAIEKHGQKNVSAKDYRYPGPRPNSKETGIAMIADSSEAALRSIKNIADEEKARETIEGIINSRLNEGELDDTGLSATDLQKIAKAFLEVWRSHNHERVKYPIKT